MSGEELLAGGNRTPEVVRVGATVRRSPGPRSAFVAELLRSLAEAGFTGAPVYLGADEQGREMFEYVEGAITTVGSERAAGAYAAAGRLLRGLHDATTGHPLAGEEECVAHGDPGPFNTVFRDGLPVCFIDWDEAHAGARLPDLAYMGWTWCVHSDWGATVQEEARRLRELRDGYGTGAADELVAAIVDAQITMERNGETRHAQEGRPAKWYDEAQGIVAWARASREYLERHAATFLATLRD